MDEAAVLPLEALRRAWFHITRRLSTRTVINPADRRVIRIFPDYGHDAMLWETRGLTRPEALGLSEKLSADCLAWWGFWATHYGREGQWSSLTDYDHFVSEGHRIAAQLAAEISPFATVEAPFEKLYPPTLDEHG